MTTEILPVILKIVESRWSGPYIGLLLHFFTSFKRFHGCFFVGLSYYVESIFYYIPLISESSRNFENISMV